MRYVAMVPIGKSSSFLNCLPVCRGKGVQVVPGGHGGESGEDVPHVGQGIDASELAGYYDRVDDRRTLAGRISPPRCSLCASRPVITPLGVVRILIPRPPNTRGMSVCPTYTRQPGRETRSIAEITGELLPPYFK